MVAKRLRLHYAERQPPQLAAGVNLLSGQDFLMRPHLRTAAQRHQHHPVVVLAHDALARWAEFAGLIHALRGTPKANGPRARPDPSSSQRLPATFFVEWPDI